ncbi:MAG TPA: glycosyltransferase family 2 protein [Candidatus Sulfotelmatobacter sp.]|nr:glycosyltransferase family 2 protein [Candidatus Sulfotelmatobacter sp.]
MALIPRIVFWACVAAIAYNYLGYPIVLLALSTLYQAKSDLLFLLRRTPRRAARAEAKASWPSVAIVISAYNEEAIIEARVKNALGIDYPPDRFEILIGLDSPSDGTAAVLREITAPRLRIFHFQERRGKLAVISDLAQRTTADILVFTDANTMFQPDCVANLARHFSNPKIGAASGEEIRVGGAAIDAGAEGLYWRYESALKFLESRTQLLHSANGGVYAIRRELFNPPPNLIVEDFQIPLDLRFQGHRIVYDPDAVAVEEIAPTFHSQFERRVRLGAGNYQTLFGRLEYLNPFKGGAAFAYWSHRVLRWLAPFFMITAFVCNMLLLRNPWYAGLLGLQILFYGLALLGYWAKKRGKAPGICKGPLYFCSMNTAFVFGFLRYCSGRQAVAWKVTPRQVRSVALPTQQKQG